MQTLTVCTSHLTWSHMKENYLKVCKSRVLLHRVFPCSLLQLLQVVKDTFSFFTMFGAAGLGIRFRYYVAAEVRYRFICAFKILCKAVRALPVSVRQHRPVGVLVVPFVSLGLENGVPLLVLVASKPSAPGWPSAPPASEPRACGCQAGGWGEQQGIWGAARDTAPEALSSSEGEKQGQKWGSEGFWGGRRGPGRAGSRCSAGLPSQPRWGRWRWGGKLVGHFLQKLQSR